MPFLLAFTSVLNLENIGPDLQLSLIQKGRCHGLRAALMRGNDEINVIASINKKGGQRKVETTRELTQYAIIFVDLLYWSVYRT